MYVCMHVCNLFSSLYDAPQSLREAGSSFTHVTYNRAVCVCMYVCMCVCVHVCILFSSFYDVCMYECMYACMYFGFFCL